MSDETTRTGTASQTRASAGALVVGFSRYRIGALLGRGGMGIVHAVEDATIGREVAIKRARDREQNDRLLDEARLQGRLEHPGVLPVYDVGSDEDGAPYFTMRRLRGATLADALRSDDAKWTRARLLGVIVDVAQAVAYAHGRGVVHRDLKPANVMLGDFGEVYVLDWGIAHEGEAQTDSSSGTPGYMAPEQLAGNAVDARADIFAIGAMLFEVLARAPLVPKGAPLEMASATLLGLDPAARVRELGCELPPELVATCARATARDVAVRHGSVAELIVELQRFLDGDRDLARRRALSVEHTARARELLATPHEPEVHVVAMRELGSALALDHHNRDAMLALSHALTELPARLPAPLLARQERQRDAFSRRVGAFAVFGYAAWIVLGLVAALMLGSNPTLSAVMIALAATQVVVCTFYSRGRFAAEPAIMFCCVVNLLLVAVTGRMFGVLLVGPLLASATSGVYAIHPFPRLAVPFVSLGCASFIVPWLLERFGILPPTGIIRLRLVSEIILIIIGIAVLAILTIAITTLTRRVSEREARSELQAWYLAALAPLENDHGPA